MPIIITTTGEANLKSSSAKVSIFHSPKNGSIERYLSQSAKIKDKVSQRGTAVFVPSIQGVLKEIGGSTITCTYDIASNELLKLFVKVKYGYGKMDRVGSVFLRVREGAAYRVLKIRTLDSVNVTFKSAKIEGCFDILTLNQAIADGAKVDSKYFHLYNLDMLSPIMEVQVLQPETLPAVNKQLVKVTNPTTGKKVNVAIVKRRRAISL